jgi:hypothetical protein
MHGKKSDAVPLAEFFQKFSDLRAGFWQECGAEPGFSVADDD